MKIQLVFAFLLAATPAFAVLPSEQLADPVLEARARALAYDGALLGVPEHVCMRHPSTYSYWGPARLRIESQLDANLDVISYSVGGTFRRADRVIWMDGRPHPAEYAPHTWMGFSTGRWDGNVLTVTTTHIKQGWHRRNGLPSSDRITLLEHFIRHGDGLTHVSIVTDPDYLTEPLIKSDDYSVVADSQGNWLWPCEYVNELPGHARDRVPSFLPGTNPFLKEFAEKHSLTQRDVLGGAETMYPEFRDQRK